MEENLTLSGIRGNKLKKAAIKAAFFSLRLSTLVTDIECTMALDSGKVLLPVSLSVNRF
jgi:hypothetical protein